MIETLALLEPNTIGVLRLFAALGLILFFFSGSLLFTYWISKDE